MPPSSSSSSRNVREGENGMMIKTERKRFVNKIKVHYNPLWFLSSFLSAYPGYDVVNVCTFDLAHTSHSVFAANLVSLLCVTSYLSTFLRSHLPTTKRDMFSLRIFAQNSLIPFALVSAALWSRHSVTRHTISQWFFRLWQMFTLNNLARESISIRSELVTVDTREKFVILEKRAFLSFFPEEMANKREKTIRQWSFGKRRPKLVPNQQNSLNGKFNFSFVHFSLVLFSMTLWPLIMTSHSDGKWGEKDAQHRKKYKESWKVAPRTFSNDFEMSSRTQKFGYFFCSSFLLLPKRLCSSVRRILRAVSKKQESKNENFLPRHLFLPSLVVFPIPEHNVYTKFAYRVHSDK